MKAPMEANGPSGQLSPAVRAEAAAWVARLHSSGRSRALEAGLRRWLLSNPAHSKAFELATEAWEIGGSIPSGALPRIARSVVQGRARHSKIFTRPRLALAAALAALCIGALLYLNHDKPVVSTAVGEQRMLSLEDGSRIFLNTDTRLFVRQDENRREVRLQSGEALFDVAKDPQRPFIVIAGDREIMALGTAFVVKRDPQRLTVTLMEGKVAVSPTSAGRDINGSIPPANRPPAPIDTPEFSTPANAVVLAPGQRLTLIHEKPPTLDEPSLEKVTAWRRGEMILDKTRLQDAVEELNRYSVVKLAVDGSAVADIRVSGIFRTGDSLRFARAVAETYNLEIAQQDRRIVISGSPN